MYRLAKCIKDVCKNHSDNVAIKYYSDGRVKSILYEDFNEASDLVAGILNEVRNSFGVIPHNYIAALVDVSDILPVIIQGILLSGSPFVCLDADNSENDLINLVEKLKIEILLTNDKHVDNIRANFTKSEKLKEFNLFDHVCEIWKTGISHGECKNSDGVSLNKRLLYAIQTSGSTGQKKIVQVIEDCILPNVLELRDVFKITSIDVIYYGSPIAFDPNIIEIFLALTSGATLFIVSSRARAASIPVLVDILFPEEYSDDNKSCVTFIQTTPSIFLSWPGELTRDRIMNRLKILALGGETFPSWDKLSGYCSPKDSLKIFNLYGITEVSCWATYHNVSADGDCHILGVPMRETLLQVKDGSGNDVKNGIGEMFIGSSSRICILDDENISKVLNKSKTEPVFRATGDLVQVEGDGKVFRFLGRKDRMIKRWGQKVNLALIEDVSKKSALVSNCCCINYERHGLVLFYQPHTFKNGNDVELRCWLKNSRLLPNSASIPDVIVQLHSLPLNSNGKIDSFQLKKILKEETDSSVGNEKLSAHKISFRLHLKSLWIYCTTGGSSVEFEERNENEGQSQLNKKSSTGFISSGGTSITALQLISKLSNAPLKVPNELLANLLSDCTFNECWKLFDETEYGESSGGVSQPAVLQNISEPVVKRRKVDHQTFFQNKAESAILSVKCRGKHVMYSQLKNNIDDSNLTENVSLSVKWKYFMKKCVDASPTVIVSKNGTNIVSVGSHSGDLVNLDFESGLLKSACHLPDRIESSLAISSCGKYGYIGCYDGHLRCINMETGETVLSFATSGMIKSTPVLVNRGSIIFGSYDQHLYCISYIFQIIWKWKGGGSFYATPCIDCHKNVVYAGLLDGTCVCLEINNGGLLWKINLSSPIFSSPVLLGSDAILFAEVSGSINCLNTTSGSLLWSYKVDGNIFSSLTSVCNSNGTLILFGCHDKNIYCLSANDISKPPSLIWKTCLSAPVFATPFVDLEKVIVVAANTTGVVFILKLTNGHLFASFKLCGEIFSSPVMHDNRIVVGCRDNYLYCLHVDSVDL